MTDSVSPEEHRKSHPTTYIITPLTLAPVYVCVCREKLFGKWGIECPQDCSCRQEEAVDRKFRLRTLRTRVVEEADLSLISEIRGLLYYNSPP